MQQNMMYQRISIELLIRQDQIRRQMIDQNLFKKYYSTYYGYYSTDCCGIYSSIIMDLQYFRTLPSYVEHFVP